MLLEASLTFCFLVFAAAAAGYMFSGWFKRFRILRVCYVSIGFTITLAVVLAFDLNDLFTISTIALQITSLCMMIASGSAKLRHRLNIPSQAA